MKFISALALASAVSAQSLVEVLSSQPSLSQLVGLLNSTGTASALAQAQNVTLLAPNNMAISAFLNSSTAGMVSQNQGLLSAILSYHVLNGTHSNFTNTSFIPTNLVDPMYSSVTGGQRVEAMGGRTTGFVSGLLANSSQVSTNGTLNFTGGVIHIINSLLTIPENITATGVALNLTAAVGAVQRAGLTQAVDTTPDVTCFLPNNAAFSRIGSSLANITNETLAQVLQYHVVAGQVLYSTDIMNGSSVSTLQMGNLTFREEGGSVYVNNAKVLIPNVLVGNGVVHVIDRVLNPMNATVVPNSSTTQDSFPGATSVTNVPFTSGVPTPTSSVRTSAAQASASSSGAAWAPAATGAMGMGALFGAAMLNL